MSKPLKPRRGTTAEHASFIGEAHEVTYDTDKQTLVTHDGLTAGGFPLAHEADVAAKVSSLDSTLRAFIAEEVAKYLPLTGGTLTGPLTGTSYVQKLSSIDATTTPSEDIYGATIRFHDKNNNLFAMLQPVQWGNGSNVLRFIVAKKDGSQGTPLSLEQTVDGRTVFTVKGKNAVTSVNGQSADAEGGVRTWAINKGDVSADTLTEEGSYYLSGDNTALPSGTNGYVIVHAVSSTSNLRQVFFRAGTANSNDHNIYTRGRNSGTWGAWVKMLTSKDTGGAGLLLNSTNVKIYSAASATLPSGGTWAVIGHSSGDGHDANLRGTYAGGTKVTMTDYGGAKFILALKIA